MDTPSLHWLRRLCDRPGTRRAALAGLLSAAGLGSAFARGAGKPRHKRRRHGKTKGKRNRPVHAQAKTKLGNHCVSPSGFDLNELFGISTQIVTDFCTEVGAGEPWIPSPRPWFVNHTFEQVPDGFEPAGTTPQEDFFAKFAALHILIDPGTTHETTVVFPNDGNLFADEFGERILVIPITLGAVQPLSVGAHEVDVSWVFRAMHCNGIAADVAVNCFPAGGTAFPRLGFTVVPGHH